MLRTIMMVVVLVSFYHCTALANPQPQTANLTKQNKIATLLHQAQNQSSMSKRIAAISEHFLGKDYQLNALGEGQYGQYDHDPLYRTDEFDCMTFVSTVIALAKSHHQNDFIHNIKKIRYHSPSINFFSRNHFVSLDWNKNNVENGILQDITQQITDQNGRPIYLTAKALINKPKFYQYHHIKHYPATPRLIPSTIDYLPLSHLFKGGRPNRYLFNQIPSGAIVEIVRPNWDMRRKIGTHINVSHMGFAIRRDNKLFYREASSKLGKVADVPLIPYLADYINHKTIKGINVQVVTDKMPSQADSTH